MNSPCLPSLLCLCLGLGCARSAAAAAPATTPRAVVNLNPGWRFHPGDVPGAAEPGFDDRAWEAVDLPHTWNARDGEDGGDNYRRGAGWYRRTIRVDPALAGRELYLQFDGASLGADVYVNGKLLGTHLGGFARFRFDATSALRPGQDNLLAVRVDNGHLGIPPTSADFTFFGGLYRSVSLLATDPVQITTTDYASDGVYLSPHNVSTDHADVTCRTLVENHGAAEAPVAVQVTVSDPHGAEVLTRTATVVVPAGARVPVEQALAFEHPHLWNGRADPWLYSVRVELRTAGRLCDAVTEPLGLRFYRIDPDAGFILNGRPYDLHGVCRHQDRIDKGWAISEADEAQDFALIRELGATAIRVAHYQQSQTWYDRCDRAGIVAWAEIPFVNGALATPEFLANAEQQLRELIRQNFNHPAIICWGIGNETSGAAAQSVLTALAPIVHAEDPGRVSTYASDHDMSDPRSFLIDVVAFNRYYGWYRGVFADFAKNLDETHARYPRLCIGVSEYGAGASIHQHQENPPPRPANGKFHPEEYQDRFHEASWATLKARPWIWCKFIWNMFDFASDGRDEGDHPGRNDKGLVTYDRRTRKDAYFFYQANWTTEPVVYLTSRRYTPRADAVTEVKVYANAPTVELVVNGVAQGARSGTDCVFRWPGVTLRPGENRIEARGDFNGRIVTDSCTWVLDPAHAAPIPPG